MVTYHNIDHIDPFVDGDLRNLKHMNDDESGSAYTKHSFSAADQKRIYYIKMKKDMQRDEQVARQNQDVEMKSDHSDSDDGKIKKKKKAAQPEEKKKGRKK
jgi:hypothetical protein